MTDAERDVAAAKAQAEAARQRLFGTVAALKHKLDPGTIANHAAEDLRERATAAAQIGVDAVRRHPGPVAAVATAAAAWLARRHIFALFRRKPKATAPPYDR